MNPLRVFIGYDSREPLAYHVLAHSIIRRASRPVSITPLALDHLQRWLFTRTRDPKQTTEFTYTRFLVPYLSGYEGVSIYMDCDMLCRTDLCDVLPEWPYDKAAWCVQHDYVPLALTKMDGQPQTRYPRKNWSSLIVFNNDRCRVLTPEYVNTASGMELHRFLWLKDEEIGALPLELNWLVGEYLRNPYAKILHYTNGGPWFPETRECDHATDWLEEYAAMRGEYAAVPA